MKLTKLAMLLLVMPIILMPVAATAANWYVDAANGDDALNPALAHSGFAPAFRTIGRAVNAAAAGDVIYVNSGTYNEYVFVGSSKTNLSIIGVGTVIIDGNMRYRDGIYFYTATNGRVENLIFQNCSSGLTNWNCPITVERCQFRDNTYGFYIQTYANATINNSLFHDNNYGLYCSSSASSYWVWHSTFADNYMGLYSAYYVDNEYVQYCLFANNAYGYYQSQNTQLNKVQYCDFWQNTNGNYPVLTTGPSYEPNYALDPQFVDRAGRNYYLSSTSPLLELRIKDENGQLATIGALKCGAVSNTNFDNWAGWQEGPEGSESAVSSSQRVALAVGGITLQSGVTEARLVSPVYDGGNTISRLIRMRFDALEFEQESPGYKSYIDYDPSTPEREIRYRVGNNPGSLGAWQTTTANASLDVTGRYYQVELVLRNLE